MNRWLILIGILILAAFLRFYQLGQIPPSLTWDEVSWGYNAYSLGIDGKDEFGRFLPHDYLESFGDFKPPMYAYLDILPIKFFGLNEFATRFPSAFFGMATVLMTYFLVKRLFYKSKHNSTYALVTSLILAISPWHIMLSRAAFEANIATFFLVTGVTCFLYAAQKNPWFFSISAISFVLSMYTFNTSRIVAPLLVVLLGVSFWKIFLMHKKEVLVAIVVGLFLILPTLQFLFSPQARLRYQEVNIFSDIDVIKTINQEISNDNNSLISKVLHNRRFAFSVEYLHHYFDNLSSDFLFINGDGNPKFSSQVVGQMYLWEIPFLIAGIIFLFRKREGKWFLVPCWILLGIIPAATARETPHALRIETTLPMFQVLVAYGLINSVNSLKQNAYRIPLRKSLLGITVLFAFFNLFYFLEYYYIHYSKEFSLEWQYGYKDTVSYVNQVDTNYDKVYLTPELGRPYIYMLFYKQYDPRLFRMNANVHRDPFGFVMVNSFGKYYFNRELAGYPNAKNVLYIDPPKDVPKNAKIVKTFYLLDGSQVLVSYTL